MASPAPFASRSAPSRAAWSAARAASASGGVAAGAVGLAGAAGAGIAGTADVRARPAVAASPRGGFMGDLSGARGGCPPGQMGLFGRARPAIAASPRGDFMGNLSGTRGVCPPEQLVLLRRTRPSKGSARRSANGPNGPAPAFQDHSLSRQSPGKRRVAYWSEPIHQTLVGKFPHRTTRPAGPPYPEGRLAYPDGRFVSRPSRYASRPCKYASRPSGSGVGGGVEAALVGLDGFVEMTTLSEDVAEAQGRRDRRAVQG